MERVMYYTHIARHSAVQDNSEGMMDCEIGPRAGHCGRRNIVQKNAVLTAQHIFAFGTQ